MRAPGGSAARLADVRAITAPVARKRGKTSVRSSDYDVLVIGGGPAGLSAASYCGRKFLRTALFEGECWGGIMTRGCPDKRIDDYPGVTPGIRAEELANSLLAFARRAEVDLVERRVEEITGEKEVRAGKDWFRGKVVILANGSTTAEAGIPREKEIADRNGGIYYEMPDPARLRGKRVVIVGGGDSAFSHAERLCGIASRITVVHRQKAPRSAAALPRELERKKVEVLLSHTVETILGSESVTGVRLRNAASGEERDLAADAVVMAVGTKPNSALLRDLKVSMDWTGQVVTDRWQRTSVPGIFAIGDVSSQLKMIVTAVAQAATAAHQAYAEVRSPYWK
jgi:thioredoxin reductase (NADPH)